MSSAWFFAFIALAGVLQPAGAAMNGALSKSMVNPWRLLGAVLMIAGVTLIAKF